MFPDFEFLWLECVELERFLVSDMRSRRLLKELEIYLFIYFF